MICCESHSPLWENLDLLILLISMINIQEFLTLKCHESLAKYSAFEQQKILYIYH